MTALRYQVLVIERGTFNVASVPDLRCEAMGASVGDAIETVREDALRALQDFEGATVGPPRPSRLTLALIELAAPYRRRQCHLRLLPSLADGQTSTMGSRCGDL
jgi:hypothetical protein